jgi:hypothetical protein
VIPSAAAGSESVVVALQRSVLKTMEFRSWAVEQQWTLSTCSGGSVPIRGCATSHYCAPRESGRVGERDRVSEREREGERQRDRETEREGERERGERR